MKSVTILFKKEDGFEKEFIERDLLWYDFIKKEMIHFKGGSLKYVYKEDPYLVQMKEEERKKIGITSTWRSLPEPSDLKIVNYNKPFHKINKSSVKKFFTEYLNYNNSNIIIEHEFEDGITFLGEENELEDFAYQAERRGLDYFYE